MIMLARSQFLPFDAHHVKELCGVSASASRLPFYRWGFLRLCFGSSALKIPAAPDRAEP